ncbi:MAG TPA: hypothetical protein VJ760_08675 [Nitrospiraceae bacterium]|nr:hypothetical protein [Nitrospiraceae bacterium]
MIQRPELVQAFERALIRGTPLSYARNVEIVEALCQEARQLGVWPPADPLDGIDTDVRLAKAINVHTTT